MPVFGALRVRRRAPSDTGRNSDRPGADGRNSNGLRIQSRPTANAVGDISQLGTDPIALVISFHVLRHPPGRGRAMCEPVGHRRIGRSEEPGGEIGLFSQME